MNEQVLEKINSFLEKSASLNFLDTNIFDMINEHKEINEIPFGDYYLEYVSSLPKLDFENVVKISREVFQLYGKENEFDSILERLKTGYYIDVGSLNKNDNNCILNATESRILLSGTCYDVVMLCHEIGHKLKYDSSISEYDSITDSFFFETPSIMLELSANDYLRDVYNVDINAGKLRKTHISSSVREENMETYIFNVIMNLKKSGNLNSSELYKKLMQNDNVINYLDSPNTSIENCVSEGLESYSYDIGYILGNYANACDNKLELLNLFLQLKDKGLNTPFTIDENMIEKSLGNHRLMNKELNDMIEESLGDNSLINSELNGRRR